MTEIQRITVRRWLESRPDKQLLKLNLTGADEESRVLWEAEIKRRGLQMPTPQPIPPPSPIHEDWLIKYKREHPAITSFSHDGCLRLMALFIGALVALYLLIRFVHWAWETPLPQ